jgi:hypothetical protein
MNETEADHITNKNQSIKGKYIYEFTIHVEAAFACYEEEQRSARIR